jgi:hypothetical protein
VIRYATVVIEGGGETMTLYHGRIDKFGSIAMDGLENTHTYVGDDGLRGGAERDRSWARVE